MRNYGVIPPSPALKEYVRYFWTLEVKLSTSESFSMKSYVDDSCGIAFQIGSPEKGIIWNESLVPSAIVYGLTTGFHTIKSMNSFSVFGVVFHSHALFSIFGFHASEFTDNAVNLQEAVDKYLLEKINEAPNTRARITIVESFLINKLLSRKSVTCIGMICDYIFSHKGLLSIKKIERHFSIHTRQLERKFQQQIGVSPVHFLKIARFQEALKLLQHSDFSKLTEIAYELEFADQSHFIKQVRRFSGHTPKELKRHQQDRIINLIIPAP